MEATQRRNGESSQKMNASSMKETGEDFQEMMDIVCSSFYEYGRKNPGMLAGIAFMVGFYFGWRVKPW
jgi:hypothetical protein